MKIDRLRLSGFKSFVDNTEVTIQSGLTGIVGPNGCGKSNILEALRWVMGATSAKALRGSGMEDVIFTGTASRPPRNMAEVCILLDNADRQAPAMFNDSDVLEIIRRIEREAGSAYRVNGKDVRQRDVQLLFADASTGANSPALVRQGQISELINAKPENRRRLLEEAAGTAGLHSRRHEAELRLRAAETNLTRLDDVQQQLEDQLGNLKRQARQATRYRNLSGHIRRAEALSLLVRWNEACDTLNSSTDQERQVGSMVEERTRRSSVAATAQAEAATALPPLREAEAHAAAAVQRLKLERDSLDREAQQAEDRALALEGQIAQIEQDLARERLQLHDGESALARLNAERNSLEDGLADETATLETKAAEAEQAQNRLAEKEHALEGLLAKAASMAAEESSLRKSIDENALEQTRLKARLEDIKTEQESIERELLDADGMAESQALLEQAKRDAQAAEDKAKETDNARLAAAEAEREAREPVRAAERQLEALKGEAKALSDLLKMDDAGLWPPVIDALTVTPGYETALAAAFGDDLNHPTDEAAPVHWELLAEETPGERPLPAGAQPLGQFVNGPHQLRRRLGQTGLVDRSDGNRLQQFLSPGQRLVSREGDLWRWDGFTASAEAETASAKRLAQRNRLVELDREIATVNDTYDLAKNALDRAAETLAQKTADEKASRQTWRETQDQVSAARDALAETEKAGAAQKTRLTTLDHSGRQIEESLSEQVQKAERMNARLDEVKERSVLDQDVSDQRANVGELRTEASTLRAAYEGQKRETQLRRERISAAARECAEWKARVDGANKQISALSERLESVQDELEQVRQVPAQLEDRRIALLSTFNTAEQERSQAADTLAEAEAHLAICDRELNQCQQALGEAREEHARLKAVLTAANERVEEVTQRIRETLNCLPEDLAEQAEVKAGAELPPMDQVDTKLERLKRERDNMGAVNLRAEQEADEIRVKLEEMESERADLEGAIAKLRRSIAELNSEGRERLQAAFNTVNENFARLFSVLFDGGTAHLEFTESDDPLAAGLEIFARPPGKRVQNMSLMSGGEQALTAMALIFAVFMANPAPVCFLDEVDAPLDDANVERFCNLLDEMTRLTETRFLIITHHALTMSRMNRLYGVTMAERGISQLVSVDLSEAQQMRAAE